MPKAWWKSKTIWANIIGGAGMLLSVAGIDVISSPEQQAEIVGAIMVVVNLYLRAITKEPLGK